MYIHVAEAGDTLYSIARRYGTSVSRLINDNGLSNVGELTVGQALIVVIPSEVYTVRRGDSLYSIATANGLTLRRLLQYNPGLTLNSTLFPGRQLTLGFTAPKRGPLRTLGYAYPHINRETLLGSLPYLSDLALFSYGFTEDGGLIEIDDGELLSLCRRYSVRPWLTLTTIGEDGGFSGEKARLLLQSEALQQRVIRRVVEVLLQKGYHTLDVDFEYIDAEQKGQFIAFLGTAAAILHENGLYLNVALAPKTSANQSGLLYEAHDYEAIGSIADTVLLMTYEWGYTYGPPMAVAPVDQVRRVVRYAVSAISPNKILMGIPNYGYDWPLPYIKGTTRATNLGNQYAVALAYRSGARILFDERAASPYFYYWQGGVKHELWFEDVRSIAAKSAVIDEFGLAGAGYWTVMRPFVQNWVYLAVNYSL